MSNTRSPREVCSTTIGTSGLMVLASFLVLGSNPSGAMAGAQEGAGAPGRLWTPGDPGSAS